MRRLIFVALVLSSAAACNWSDLDAEFVAGVPQKSELKVNPPTQTKQQQPLQSDGLGTQQDGLQSDQFKQLNDAATNINKMIDAMAGGLDLVRQYPPTVRETDRRIWGPFPDKGNPGLDVQLVMARNVDGFEYSVQWRKKPGDFTPIITGTFKGEQASEGSGEFVLDADKARGLGIAVDDSTWKTLTLGYEHLSDAIQVRLQVDREDGTQASYRHSNHKDGGGDMSYLDDTGLFTFQVDAVWQADHAGNIRAVAGTGPVSSVHYRECWGADLQMVYWSKDWVDTGSATQPCVALGTDGLCEVGDKGLCTPQLP